MYCCGVKKGVVKKRRREACSLKVGADVNTCVDWQHRKVRYGILNTVDQLLKPIAVRPKYIIINTCGERLSALVNTPKSTQ